MSTINADALKLAYRDLKVWIDGVKKSEINERDIETFIFYRIFRDVLRWGKRVTRIGTRGIKTDLRLKPGGHIKTEEKEIPIEIKVPGIRGEKWSKGLKQVLGYCIKLGKKYGILTNGDRWEFIEVIDNQEQTGKVIGVWYLYSWSKKLDRKNEVFFHFLLPTEIISLFRLQSKITGKDERITSLFEIYRKAASSLNDNFISLLEKR